MAALHSTAYAHIDIMPDICTLICTFARSELWIIEVWIIKVGRLCDFLYRIAGNFLPFSNFYLANFLSRVYDNLHKAYGPLGEIQVYPEKIFGCPFINHKSSNEDLIKV